ncbi:MAG TPA: ABC transporter ATP-binding protein [Candidatus Dormibacteraeota bacterium]|nr:ABC transporter ATP-binding protein [Candidatus Dormibacteraeota bacterium]
METLAPDRPATRIPADILVETHGLTKHFGARAAVDGVDLRIPAGVAFGLLGPNGAGKTTLIRTLLGLTHATAGTMQVMGHAMPREHAKALARVGAVVEEPRFHDHLTGRQNLKIVSALLTDEATARIPQVLDRVGLHARADEPVGAYSLGMRQRLGIARCLLNDPRLLILDEPMNGLDPAGIQEFRGLVRSLVHEGRTVLISSHMLDEIEKTCDWVAIIDRGKLIRQGRLADLRDGAAHQVLVACDNNARAVTILEHQEMVREVKVDEAGLLLCTLSSADAAAAVNRVLVTAGIAVSRLEPARVTLEERFLDITSRLQSAEEIPA